MPKIKSKNIDHGRKRKIINKYKIFKIAVLRVLQKYFIQNNKQFLSRIELDCLNRTS